MKAGVLAAPTPPSCSPAGITAEIETRGLMGDFKQKGDEASL